MQYEIYGIQFTKEGEMHNAHDGLSNAAAIVKATDDFAEIFERYFDEVAKSADKFFTVRMGAWHYGLNQIDDKTIMISKHDTNIKMYSFGYIVP